MANMAIYHFSAQIIGRSDGRSSVAAAAYRSGEALTDERTGTECRYDRRRERIAHTEILAPAGSPAWATDRNSLWNAVERGERRKDAQLAREFEIALPVELTEQQNQDLVRDWVQAEFIPLGVVVDISHHRDRRGRNPHAHIMKTTRAIDGDGFGPKLRDLNRAEQLEQWRSSWAEAVNSALARAGHQARVDHRSLEAQGIDYRIAYTSPSLAAIFAIVTAGLAVTAQLQSLITGNIRILGEQDGLPQLPVANVMLVRSTQHPSPITDCMAGYIIEGFK